MLGLVLFNIFVGNKESEIDCLFRKTADNAKLSGAIDRIKKERCPVEPGQA